MGWGTPFKWNHGISRGIHWGFVHRSTEHVREHRETGQPACPSPHPSSVPHPSCAPRARRRGQVFDGVSCASAAAAGDKYLAPGDVDPWAAFGLAPDASGAAAVAGFEAEVALHRKLETPSSVTPSFTIHNNAKIHTLPLCSLILSFAPHARFSRALPWEVTSLWRGAWRWS